MYHGKRIGVVIPAHNEAPAIAKVVRGLLDLPDCPIDVVVVCDNASTDATAAEAISAGALVVAESRKGYGHACVAAIRAMPPVDVLVFVDGDHANRADDVTRLIDAWIAGADLVIGSRQLGQAERGSQTLIQYLGNRFAGWWLTHLFGTRVTDLGPLRAIAPQALASLNLNAPHFSWTVDMQIAALQAGYRVREVPVATKVRIGRSKVSGTVRGTWGASRAILGALIKATAQRWRSGGSNRPLPNAGWPRHRPREGR